MPLLDFRDGSADCSVTAYGRFQSGRFVAPEDQNNNLIIFQEFNSYWKRQFRNLCKTWFQRIKRCSTDWVWFKRKKINKPKIKKVQQYTNYWKHYVYTHTPPYCKFNTNAFTNKKTRNCSWVKGRHWLTLTFVFLLARLW